MREAGFHATGGVLFDNAALRCLVDYLVKGWQQLFRFVHRLLGCKLTILFNSLLERVFLFSVYQCPFLGLAHRLFGGSSDWHGFKM